MTKRYVSGARKSDSKSEGEVEIEVDTMQLLVGSALWQDVFVLQ